MSWTLVTGGATRLGADICRILAQNGYPVVVHYNKNREEAEKVVADCQKFGVDANLIQGDFSSVQLTEEFAERYVAQFKQVAHLINNVGNYLVKSALHTSIEEWMTLFQTNLQAPFIIMKKMTPLLIASQGSIINLGTFGLERIKANTYCTAYHLTKVALWSLTRSLAAELAPDGVRVNMVSPGQLSISEDLPQNLNSLPMHRAGLCSEVVRVILFLIDPKSAYVTGQNIEVAGALGL